MSYTGKFKLDVFISYAAADDEDGWVSHFRKGLADRLIQRTKGAELGMASSGAADFNLRILRDTAILVCVVSPAWRESRSTDFVEFERVAIKLSGVPIRDRIIKVVKAPTVDDYLGALTDARRLFLFQQEPDNVRTFKPSTVRTFKPGTKEFEDSVSAVARGILSTLDSLKIRGSGKKVSDTFDIIFSPELSDDEIRTSFAALADYYRACGGIGLAIEQQSTEVHAKESVNV